MVLVCFTLGAGAQEVPAPVLSKIIKSYTSKGLKWEKTYAPDLNNEARNKLFQAQECYVGRHVTVVTVTATKPKDWFFKVRYNDQLTSKQHDCVPVNHYGSDYWCNELTVYAPAPALKNSEKCMTVLAYDKGDMALPVYVVVFTK